MKVKVKMVIGVTSLTVVRYKPHEKWVVHHRGIISSGIQQQFDSSVKKKIPIPIV